MVDDARNRITRNSSSKLSCAVKIYKYMYRIKYFQSASDSRSRAQEVAKGWINKSTAMAIKANHMDVIKSTLDLSWPSSNKPLYPCMLDLITCLTALAEQSLSRLPTDISDEFSCVEVQLTVVSPRSSQLLSKVVQGADRMSW